MMASASSYSSTRETTNFARLSRLLLDICADLLRDVLDKRIPFISFVRTIQLKKQDLWEILNVEQKRLLFPPGGQFQGTYKDLDVSILYVLLRSIGNIQPHSEGWGKLPNISDRSISANIERIRLSRNRLYGHITTASVDDADFNVIWGDIKRDVSELESSLLTGDKYEDAMAMLETEEIDPESMRLYAETLQAMYVQETEAKKILLEYERVLYDIKNTGISTQHDLITGLRSLGDLLHSTISRIEIHKDIQKRNELIDKATRLLKRILGQTEVQKISAYDGIMKKLLEEGWAVISGLPGNGKTTIACHVMNDIVNGRVAGVKGKQPLLISKPSEWVDVVSPYNNLIIFIDNMFGTYSLSDVKEWTCVLENATDAVSDTEDPRRNFLLVAIRTEIYKESLPLVHDNHLFQSVFDLSDESNFTKEEKLEMLRNCTKNCPLTVNEESEIILEVSRYIGFPQCCSLFHRNPNLHTRGADFFKKPVYFLTDQLNKIWKIDDIKFSALALIMMHGGKLHESIFDSLSDKIDSVLAMCRVENSRNTRKNLLNAAQSLVGTYLSQDDHFFIFSHDSIHFAVAMVLWKSNCKEVIQNCSVDFLPNVSTGMQSSEHFDTVCMPKYHYPILADRIIDEIKSRHHISYRSVAEMKIWDDCNLCTEISKHSSTCCTDGQFDWNKKDENNHRILYYAVGSRNIPFIKYLLSRSLSQTHLDQGLTAACELGELSSFDILIKANANANAETTFAAVNGKNEAIFRKLIALNLDICSTHKSRSNVHIIELMEDKFTILQDICAQNKLNFLKLCIAKLTKQQFLFTAAKQHLLHYASIGGSEEIVRYLERMGMDISQKDDKCFSSVIHMACYSGNFKLVDYLISEYEQLLEERDQDNHTALHYTAAGTGSLDVTKYLISKGLDVCIKDSVGQTVLHLASNRGHLGLVKYLCEHCHDLIQMQGEFNSTTLHSTAWRTGSLDVAKYLIIKGLDVHTKDSLGRTVLHWASVRGHLSLVKYLCEHHHGLIQMTGEANSTALHYTAAGTGSVEVGKYLISKGLDVHTKDSVGRTVLHWASVRGHLSLVKYLCEHHHDLIQMTGEFNGTALHDTGVGTGSVEVGKYLISKGLDIHTKDSVGRTVLHLASERGNLSLVKYLCEHHHDLIRMTGQLKGTALHYTAAGTGSVDVLKYLISKGLDVQTKDTVGRTVLHWASYRGHLSLVKYLCEHHNNLIQITGQFNSTALHYTADGTESVEVTEYLISKGLDVHTKDSVGRTVLHWASYRGHLSLVKYLCEHHHDLIQITGEFNSTTLHYTAAGTGSVDVAKYLISKGLDIHTRDDKDETVYDLAVSKGLVDLVAYLKSY